MVNLGKYLLVVILHIPFSGIGSDFGEFYYMFFISFIIVSILFFGVIMDLFLEFRVCELYSKNEPLIVYDENVIHIRHRGLFLSWEEVQRIEFKEIKETLIFHKKSSSKRHKIDLTYFQEASEEIYLEIRKCHLSTF